MPNLGGWEFVILIGVLVLLFGAKRLPDMARSVGQSARVLKGEMKGLKSDGDDRARQARADGTTAPTTATAPANEQAPQSAQAATPEPGRTAGPGDSSG